MGSARRGKLRTKKQKKSGGLDIKWMMSGEDANVRTFLTSTRLSWRAVLRGGSTFCSCSPSSAASPPASSSLSLWSRQVTRKSSSGSNPPQPMKAPRRLKETKRKDKTIRRTCPPLRNPKPKNTPAHMGRPSKIINQPCQRFPSWPGKNPSTCPKPFQPHNVDAVDLFIFTTIISHFYILQYN